MAEIGLAEEHRGPPLMLVAIVYAGFLVGGNVASRSVPGGLPSAFDPRVLSDAYFAAHPGAVQALSFFRFGAAIPLAVFTATVVSRLQFLGMRVAGVHIALAGGILASAFLGAAGCSLWVLSQPGVSELPAVTRPLHLLYFVASGPACMASFGLLVAGVSVVPGLARLVPRWLMVFGLAVAALAELSVLTFLVPALAELLGLVRFAGLVWMIAVGARLPRARPAP